MKAIWDEDEQAWFLPGDPSRRPHRGYEPIWSEKRQAWCQDSANSYYDLETEAYRDRETNLPINQPDCPDKTFAHGRHVYEHPDGQRMCPGISDFEVNVFSMRPGDEYHLIKTDHGIIGDIEVVRGEQP